MFVACYWSQLCGKSQREKTIAERGARKMEACVNTLAGLMWTIRQFCFALFVFLLQLIRLQLVI